MWRYTSDPVKILFFDARALAPISLWLCHMRLWTLILAGIGIIFFAVLSWCGWTLPVALRMASAWWFGPVRPRLPTNRKRGYY